MYFVYILRSLKPKTRPYYIGVTSNLLLRLNQHNSPFNRGYTKGGRWELVYVEGYMTMFDAYRREGKLKQRGNVWYGVMKRVRRSIENLVPYPDYRLAHEVNTEEIQLTTRCHAAVP